MVDLSVGLQKSDPGEVGMFLCSSCENRGPPSLGEQMEQTGKLELTGWEKAQTLIVVFNI